MRCARHSTSLVFACIHKSYIICNVTVYHAFEIFGAGHDTIKTCPGPYSTPAPGQVAKPCAGTFDRIDGEFRPRHGIAGLRESMARVVFLDVSFRDRLDVYIYI